MSRSPFITTFSGRLYTPHSPKVGDVNILDIANSLANTCRFTGHTDGFYSVAEHSVLASQWVPPEYAFEALMHDAHEAYVGDMAAPTKEGLPDYNRMEDANWLTVAAAFGIDPQLHESVKEVDIALCRAEMLRLFSHHARNLTRHGCLTRGHEFFEGVREIDPEIRQLNPVDAKREFLQRFDYLWEQRTYVQFPSAKPSVI